MAEAVVNAVVKQLICATTEWLKEEVSLINGVEEELENMSMKMQTFQKVLEDAEKKSMKEKIVKQWLEKIKDIAYDMEDVMDEWNTRVLKLKLKDGSSELKSSSKFINKINCFSMIKEVDWRHDLAVRIRDINRNINMLSSHIDQLNLFSRVLKSNDMSNKTIDSVDRMTTSSIEESLVHGRDDDKKYLLSNVLDEINNAQVIVIVGAGGLGKTTLAQLVYNDEKVREKFDNRIWVCVSSPFDEFKVAQGILEGMKVCHTEMTHLQTLHECIKESLSKKKFLLVLDDVWDKNSGKWERLRMCLKFGASESRVIVTTRSEEVAKILSSTTTSIFRPSLISSSDCWLLMRHAAFQGRCEEDCSQLEDIGKRIANKCKGLPLLAKVLGGLLRSKDTIGEWEEVLDYEIWEMEEAELELFPHLFLSYKELSPALKRCFSFCALFPKDCIIAVDQLISLWMTEISLDWRTTKDGTALTGQRYIRFLKSCAFLEEAYSEGHPDAVKMHDIMHDFALHLSGHEFLSLVEVNNSGSSELQTYAKNMKARHLYVYGGIKNLSSLCNVEKLRTCHVYGLPQHVTLNLVKQLKVVKALYLQSCGLVELPEEVGKLIHLRTLDLSYNYWLCRIPETIEELYNLQYLYFGQQHGQPLKLPKSLGKLINLESMKEFPVQRGKSNLGMLKNLNKLGGALHFVFNSSYSDEADAEDANLRSKKNITELAFDFHLNKVTNGVVEALQPPPGLQHLFIGSFKGEKFLPNWITSLNYLKELCLYDAVEALSIPPLGSLPSLERLIIENFSVLKLIGKEFLGIEDNTSSKKVCVAFPKLLNFQLLRCPKLEEWEDIKAEDEHRITVMPKLKCLQIECRKLEVLPHRIVLKAASLEELSSSLSFSVEDSCVQLPPKLQSLKIENFKGVILPNSILCLNHLIVLRIQTADHVECLPALGKLPCLEDLYLNRLIILQSIGREFLGLDSDNMEMHVSFPKLLKLSISSCNELKEWEDIEDEEGDMITLMPKLEHLSIVCCAQLKSLPSRILRKAPRLKMLGIGYCNTLLAKSVREDQQLMLHIEKIHLEGSE